MAGEGPPNDDDLIDRGIALIAFGLGSISGAVVGFLLAWVVFHA